MQSTTTSKTVAEHALPALQHAQAGARTKVLSCKAGATAEYVFPHTPKLWLFTTHAGTIPYV